METTCSATLETVVIECPDFADGICHQKGCPRFLCRVSKQGIDDEGNQLYGGACILNGETEWFDDCLPYQGDVSRKESADQDIPAVTQIDKIHTDLQEVKATIKRMDARDINRGKRKAAIQKQEVCFAIWDRGRQSETIRRNAKGKVTYEDVYTYYKRELSANGIKDANEFALLLNRRSKRLSSQNSRARPVE